MYGMVTERLEVRLDPAQRRELARLAAERGEGLSQLIRRGIELLLDEEQSARRAAAARRLCETDLGYELPDPQALSRELSESHDPGIR
jgi:hypothetical protein